MYLRSDSSSSLKNDCDILRPSDLVEHSEWARNITARSDFYIFTSLLWVRRSTEGVHCLNNSIVPAESIDEYSEVALPTTIDTEPDLGLLQHHRDRLMAAAEAIQWRATTAFMKNTTMEHLKMGIESYMRGLSDLPANCIERRKVRLRIDCGGHVSVDSTLIDCQSIADYEVLTWFVPHSLIMHIDTAHSSSQRRSNIFVDLQSTSPSIFTTHKTSYRAHYDAARARTGITPCAPTEKEVLLYNDKGEIMEASLCTVYFFRDGQWVTPSAGCGGNLGVTRRLALGRGLCKEDIIDSASLRHGEFVWLSNGARGFFVGKIILERSDMTVQGYRSD